MKNGDQSTHFIKRTSVQKNAFESGKKERKEQQLHRDI
ncbi:hypothetical protein BVRB_2g031420 [Beta vulgaris subsp. vulgaris]|nr:hypothetical protein BVRB_2g031420 [Beta vulgaris subsp. vulgaris]